MSSVASNFQEPSVPRSVAFSLTRSTNSTNASIRPGADSEPGKFSGLESRLTIRRAVPNESRTPRLVPVVLDLVAAQDIEKAKGKGPISQTRLTRQAHEQGAVLGHADVSLLLNMSVGDMGRSVTHLQELGREKADQAGRPGDFHSAEDVEHYVQCFRRIQHNAVTKGCPLEETAQATGHSVIGPPGIPQSHDGVRIPSLADPERKEDSRSTGSNRMGELGPGGVMSPRSPAQSRRPGGTSIAKSGCLISLISLKSGCLISRARKVDV